MRCCTKTYMLSAGVAFSILLQQQAASAFCFNEAAARYNVAPQLVWSISQHENPKQDPGAVNQNTDGSYDYGLMQINTIHEPALRRAGISWESLADPCTNVMVGAWLLSQRIQEYGYTWKAIGAYHSKTPSKRDRYARNIEKILSRLSGSPVAQQQQIASHTTGGQVDAHTSVQ